MTKALHATARHEHVVELDVDPSAVTVQVSSRPPGTPPRPTHMASNSSANFCVGRRHSYSNLLEVRKRLLSLGSSAC